MSETTEQKKKEFTLVIPDHVAIIMDGNRRWAKKRNFPSLVGHVKGTDTLIKIVECASNWGIKTLTVYSFSKENWKRSKDEIDGLMNLFEKTMIEKREYFRKKGVRIDYIGDLSDFPGSVKKAFYDAKEATKDGEKIDLILALGYSARDEMVRAIKGIVQDCEMKKISKEDLTENLITKYLDTDKQKDPELLIRTSGEHRISNFLLWQIAYTEVFMTEVLWPDFTEKNFMDAIVDYSQRARRFGK